MDFRKNHFNLWQKIVWELIRRRLSDKTYAKWELQRWLNGGNIDNPKTFNEKIQWLKLHNRDPLYTKLADKYVVRDYVSERIGAKYLNELYFVFDEPEQITLANLPDSFVLKANHASGTNLIVFDKSTLDEQEVRATAQRWMSKNYYKSKREWVYKHIPPKVVCERLLVDEQGKPPIDYKVFCFNGEPRFIQLDIDRFGDHGRVFFDTDWRKLEFEFRYHKTTQEIKRPIHLVEMMELARKLATGIPFVRVDFYALPEIVFGEMTFYPENGFAPFRPASWDLKLGEYLQLENENVK